MEKISIKRFIKVAVILMATLCLACKPNHDKKNDLINAVMMDNSVNEFDYLYDNWEDILIKSKHTFYCDSFKINQYTIPQRRDNFFDYKIAEYCSSGVNFFFSLNDNVYYHYGSDVYLKRLGLKDENNIFNYRETIYKGLSLQKNLNYILKTDKLFSNFSFKNSTQRKYLDNLLYVVFDSISGFKGLNNKNQKLPASIQQLAKCEKHSYFFMKDSSRIYTVFIDTLDNNLSVRIDLIGKENMFHVFF